MGRLKKFWIQLKLLPLRFKVFYGQTLMRFGIVPAALIRDFQPNPMLKYPRNENCWCGSYKKAKHCCLPKQAPVMPADMVPKLKSFINQVLLMQRSNDKGIKLL
jgi:hypothetical protein